MRKLSNTEAELKNSVAYKKKCVKEYGNKNLVKYRVLLSWQFIR